MDDFSGTAEELAALAGVHVTTARRWKRGGMPEPVRRLLHILVNGDLGALSRAWRGFRVAGALIVGPDGITATPGEVLAIPFVRAQVASYQARQRFAVQADWVDGRYVDGAQTDAPARA